MSSHSHYPHFTQSPTSLPERERDQTYWIAALLGTLVAACITHFLLSFLGSAILPIPVLLWNFFVWLMPSRFVLGLRPGLSAASDKIPVGALEASTEHAAKSEVVRDVFKLNSPQKIAHSRAVSIAPPGLGNWDNSCYQNSILQALASVRSLQDFYEQISRTTTQLLPATTLGALKDVIKDLNDESNRGHKMWPPPKLKSMSSWQQQDAQEYFSKIMDEVEKDTVALSRNGKAAEQLSGLSSICQPGPGESCSGRTPLSDCNSSLDVSSKPSERLTNPLDGLLAQRVGCTQCGYVEGLSLIPFNCITLPIGKKWSYDLDTCLNEFSAVEMIEGVDCAKCTLLQARHQLRQQSERLATESDEESQQPLTEHDHLAYTAQLESRLEAITEALQDEDFSDATLRHKCQISNKQKVSSTKSKQCMIMRAPKCLVLHVNRSLFDETTGAQLKNYADIHYQSAIDISPWCIGKRVKVNLTDGASATEEWEMDPTRSMAAHSEYFQPTFERKYKLSALVTHYGRHENGHYVAYRESHQTPPPIIHLEAERLDQDLLIESRDSWWRLSDEDVSPVTEEDALSQGGVFMMFYERVEPDYAPASVSPIPADIPTDSAVRATSVLEAAVAVEPIYKSSSGMTQEKIQPAEAVDLIESDGPAAVAKVTRPPLGRDKGESLTEPPLEEMDERSNSSTGPSTRQIQQASRVDRPKKAISPMTMRTAGPQQRSSEDIDRFKGLSMVATT